MNTLLRLVLLAPIAYIVALVAGAGTVAIGMFGGQLDSDTAPIALGLTVGLTLYGGLLSFVPALIFFIAAETLGWRSILYYLAAGGLIGFLCGEATMAFDGLAFEPNLRVLCLAGGFVGGAVFWLIAGKIAGVGASPGKPTSPA